MVVGDESYGARASPGADGPAHDRSLRVRIFDGVGRGVSAVRLRVSCPHSDRLMTTFDREFTVAELCEESIVIVEKQLQHGHIDE